MVYRCFQLQDSQFRIAYSGRPCNTVLLEQGTHWRYTHFGPQFSVIFIDLPYLTSFRRHGMGDGGEDCIAYLCRGAAFKMGSVYRFNAVPERYLTRICMIVIP